MGHYFLDKQYLHLDTLAPQENMASNCVPFSTWKNVTKIKVVPAIQGLQLFLNHPLLTCDVILWTRTSMNHWGPAALNNLDAANQNSLKKIYN